MYASLCDMFSFVIGQKLLCANFFYPHSRFPAISKLTLLRTVFLNRHDVLCHRLCFFVRLFFVISRENFVQSHDQVCRL